MSLSDDLYRSGELDTDQPLVRIKRGRGDSRYNPASNPNRGRKRIRWGKHQLCHSKQIKLMQNRSPETASQPRHFSCWHIPRCSTSDTILSLHKDLPAAAAARASESCHTKPRQIENPDTEKQKYRAKFKEFLQWPGTYMSLELMKTSTKKSLNADRKFWIASSLWRTKTVHYCPSLARFGPSFNQRRCCLCPPKQNLGQAQAPRPRISQALHQNLQRRLSMGLLC